MPVKSPTTACTIGPQLKIRGSIAGAGNLTIEGSVVGTLSLQGHLVLRESGYLEAEIEVVSAEIYGHVHGDIKASDSVTIYAGAQVFGNIQAAAIELQEGACVQGTLDMNVQLPDDLKGVHLS